MATGYTHPFEIYRTNLTLALRMLSFGQDWRQRAGTLEKLRTERDCETLRQTREAATTARDWSEFNADIQTAARDYFATSSNIWQQGLGFAVHDQGAFGDAIREALRGWQANWGDQWQRQWQEQWRKVVDLNAAGTPVRDWMQQVEQTVSSALNSEGPAAAHPADAPQTSSAAASAVRAQVSGGDQHVG